MSKITNIEHWPKGLKTFTYMSKSCDISTKDLETEIKKKKVYQDLITRGKRCISNYMRGIDSHAKIQKNADVIVEILDLRWLYRHEKKDFFDFLTIMFWMPNGFLMTKFSALFLEEFWPPAKKLMITWIFLP